MADTALSKLARIREELNRMFLERIDLIDGAIVAMLSANHVLIIGPPGTAKSMLADELCRRIEGANYFQWLLTKFSTPEEIFGAVSLKAEGMPSGVSAILSQGSLTSGVVTLTFNSTTTAVAQTVPITLFGVSGSRVHSATFYLHVTPL